MTGIDHDKVVASVLAAEEESDRPTIGTPDGIVVVVEIGTSEVGSAEGIWDGELGQIDGPEVGPIETVGLVDGTILG